MYRSILVPLDGSPFAEQALAVALTIAEGCGAKVTLVRAWDPASYRYTSELTPPFLDPAAHDKLVAADYVNSTAAHLRPGTRVTIDAAVVAGSAPEAIKECATNQSADLIVMTTHGLTGWNRAWIGSVADAVVRVVTTPVLLCRPLEPAVAGFSGRFERVLIALDGSAEAEQVLSHAVEVGGNCRFVLLRVVRPVVTPVHPYAYAAPAWEADDSATEEVFTHARDYLNGVARRIRANHPQASVDADVLLAERTGTAIVEAARHYEADLVAVTTHARRGVRLVLGSVADKVLRGTHSSVLVLRPTAEAATGDESGAAVAGAVTGRE
jgi:nucleotide-binding universal stress UspA family protein